MDEIKERIQQTIENLQSKKQLLERHKEQYIELKFKLFDYDKLPKDSHPQVKVQLNPKLRTVGQLVDPQQILVLLGCEYYVERTPIQAVELVERKLKFLQETIIAFDKKLREAEKTLKDLNTLNVKKDDSVETEANDEGLPFMDIREELDEDGNVINTFIEPQNEQKLRDFGVQNGIMAEDEDNELQELLRDMEIHPKKEANRPKIEEIKSEENNNDKIKSEDIDDDAQEEIEQKGENPSRVLEEKAVEEIVVERDLGSGMPNSVMTDFIVERDEDNAVMDTIVERDLSDDDNEIEKTNSEARDDKSDEFFALMKEMGIVSKSSQSISSTMSNEDKLKTNELEEVSFDDNINEEVGMKFAPNQLAIDEEDLLQLQVIADEIDEDELEYGFDEDDEDEDEDEKEEDFNESDYDDENWDFSTNENSLIPESHRDLFMKELERVREEKMKALKEEEGQLEVENDLNKTDDQVWKKKKKSVSFASELQIKEVENISEQLKEAQHDIKVSRFKKERGNFAIPYFTKNGAINNLDSDVQDKEGAVDDLQDKVVADVIDRSDIVTSDVIDKEEDAETPKRVSKFKQSKQQLKSEPVAISVPMNEPILVSNEDEYQNIKKYALDDSDEDESLLNSITSDIQVFNPDDVDEENLEIDEDEDDEDQGPMLVDHIVEKEDVETPEYYVDDRMLEKEYKDLRKKMIAKYGESQRLAEERIISKDVDEEEEFEPIDENGNPIKVSRFRKSLK